MTMNDSILVHTTLNGEAVEFLCQPHHSLLDALRQRLGLMGSKECCNNGNCGACSVILDGVLVNSCLVLAAEAEGKTITTIEGIAPIGGLHPLQKAFLEQGAVQCGICSSGFIVAAKALLDRNPHPSEEEVRRWLAGNLCRCTGYDKIVRAVLAAASVNERNMISAKEEENRSSVAAAAYRTIGTSPVRPDAIEKVTGQALYGADFNLPGMLFGAVLRSPHAHARILSIATASALAMPGVKAVITAADLPQKNGHLDDPSDFIYGVRGNILAQEKVLYFGHAVAAVAATSPELAARAASKIIVEYEVLPAVLDVRQAMEDEHLLHPDLHTDAMGKKGEQSSNIAAHFQHISGDLEQGFAQSDVIVTREFSTATVHQGYLEPQNAVALFSADGQATVWTSTQDPFGLRDQLAGVLAMPVGKIRVIPLEIGGGFGGKNTIYLQPLALLLSRASGHHAVKMTMNYAETLAATGPTSSSVIEVRMGATKAGKITAAQATLAYAAGAFPGSPVTSGMSGIFGSYDLENVRIDGYDVVVNRPKVESYRAPGGTNASFASEVVIDELAQKLGIDPLDFRLRNAARSGGPGPFGTVHGPIGCQEVLQALHASAHFQSPLTQPSDRVQQVPPKNLKIGRGMALAYWSNYGGKSSASAAVNSDGTVSLVEGSVDLAGARLVIAMQLAEALEIPLERIRAVVGDTDTVGYTEGSYGSRVTFATGMAVHELAIKIKSECCQRAALLWDVEVESITYRDGIFQTLDREMTFKELAGRLDETGGAVVASAAVRAEKWGPSFAAHLVDVAVDGETGKVYLLRYTAVQDVGKAIHPQLVEGQIQGGLAQGVGWALSEGYFYDDQGHLLNTSLLDYRLSTCLDLPALEVILVEVPNPAHPFGVRGVGEAPILPPPGAIANAIQQAVGVRLRELPMTPTVVLEALWQSSTSPA